MSCKYKAPNGEQSQLYDSLYKDYGHQTAFKNWAKTQTTEFKEWYGDGEMNAVNEPVVQDGEFKNSKGDVIPIDKIDVNNNISLSEAAEQIEYLQNVFKNIEVDVEVLFDADIEGAAQVQATADKKARIKINPRKAQKDSIFHEFGHLYVDLLGNTKIVNRGIENLQGTELWNKVAKLYPELSDEQLGKEVLTTAIGIESAKYYDERIRLRKLRNGSILDKIKAFGIWFQSAIKIIGDKFGLNNNQARRLAYELTGGKLRSTLTGKLSKQVQKQKVIDITSLINESKRLSQTQNGKNYQDKKGNLFRRVTSVIDDLRGKFDRESVIDNLIKSNKSEWAHFQSADEIATFWADKREEGTGIHNIAEDYINARNRGETRDAGRKVAIDNLYVPENVGSLDEDGIRYYSGMDKAKVEGYIDNIIDFIESLYSKGYKLYPEVKISDVEMGVAGTIDLLVVKPDGSVMVYDWKTKELGKFDNFYTNHGKLLGIMSNIDKSKASEYSLQLSTYKLMLERKGFTVANLAIVPLVGIATTDVNGETKYKDVGLAEDLQGQINGVLPLKSLSEELKDVFNIKEDIEASLELVNQTEAYIENQAEKIHRLSKTKDWLKNLLVNLEKSITRVRATATPETAERVEKSLSELIDKVDVADENLAITAYTEYVVKGITDLYKRFGDRYAIIEENGTKKKKLIKGYSSYTWQDIKNLEETNPKEFMDFIAFMINANMFLEQIVQIKDLPKTAGDEVNIVFATLKQLEGDISDMQIKFDRLNLELDKRYVELSSNPLYGNRGVLKGYEHFFKAQEDESFMQRNFDAMADTHNSYMANVMRMYDYKMRSMEEDVESSIKAWNKQVEKLEAVGSNVDKFVDKKSGKLIPKIDYDKYIAARAEAYRRANKFEKGSDQWKAIVNEFYNNSVEPLSPEEQKAFVEEKRKELNAADFQTWFDKNTYEVKNGRAWKKSSPIFRPKASIFTNEVYKSYNETELEFWNYLNNTFAYLVDHTKSSIVKAGYLPAIPNSQRGIMEQVLGTLGWYDKGKYDADKGVVVNEAGEVVQFLPFKYNNLLNQEELIPIPPDASPEVRDEINEENREKRKRNREAHAAAIEKDLKKVMPIFFREALKHKHKKAMEFELLRVRKSFENNHRIKVMKNGKPVADKTRKMRGLENNEVDKTTIGSNTLDHYNDWLKMVFYEEFEVDEATFQKIARVLQNYTSFKSMALNVFSAANNQTYGEMISAIEAGAKEFFDKKDWAVATKEYAQGITSYFADDADSFKFSSKQSAFMHMIPIMQDYKELALTEDPNLSVANIALKKMGTAFSKVYAFEHMSEHNLQNRVLFAMAKSHKIVNGQALSFNEFKRGKVVPVDKQLIKENPEKAKEQVAKNKEIEADLKKDWDKLTSLYDAFEFVDGDIKLKDGIELAKDEIAEFQRRVIGVNQYLHGIYNKQDAGAIQQYALGRLAIQFKKWMRPGWNKRWGTKFGKSFWNERRRMTDEGIYITTFNFLTAPIQDNVKEWRESEEMTFLQAAKNITKDYARFLTNMRLHWHTLNDGQKANVRRTALEYLTFSMAIGIGYLLREMKGDDDEPSTALLLALYQADRTATELTTYVPLAVTAGYAGGGWLNEAKKLLKSPAASMNTIEAAIRIGREIVFYPFADDEDLTYKGGVYAGQNKLGTLVKKMIPLYNQYHKFNFLDKNYKYYKLF